MLVRRRAQRTAADEQAEKCMARIQQRRLPLVGQQVRGMVLSKPLAHPRVWEGVCQVRVWE